MRRERLIGHVGSQISGTWAATRGLHQGRRDWTILLLSGRVFWSRHLSKYLWTDMNVVSRNPASATRRIKGWDSGGDWRSATATVHWRLNSRASRVSRTMAISLANLAAERIDAPSETSEFVHVGDHLGEFSLVSGGRRRLEIFSFPLNSSHLRPLRWIGRCRCYGRVGGGLGAVGRGAVFGHGMPWRLSGGLDLVWV